MLESKSGLFQFFLCNFLQLQKGEKHAAASLAVNGFREGESVGVTMSSSVPKFTEQACEPEEKGKEIERQGERKKWGLR